MQSRRCSSSIGWEEALFDSVCSGRHGILHGLALGCRRFMLRTLQSQVKEANCFELDSYCWISFFHFSSSNTYAPPPKAHVSTRAVLASVAISCHALLSKTLDEMT
ncbi:hypothetical protein NW759_013264 [Fusarium solani]|nr:hypothetical protein NW759_013264 [Fusarium solani]